MIEGEAGAGDGAGVSMSTPASMSADEAARSPWGLVLATLSKTGPVREANEDCCGHERQGPSAIVLAIADGVSGYRGGETASQMAIDVTLRAFRELTPTLKLETRLARAAQQANIEIHDLALIVPELRGMATTLTAIAIRDGYLVAAHVGDSRLYLIRNGKAVQLTKDHRTGQATLTRSVGRELIAAIDRLSRPLQADDVLLLCTDGVHGAVSNEALARLAADADPGRACRAVLEAALAAHSTDNVTVAVARVVGPAVERPGPVGMTERLRRLVRRA